MIAMPIPVKKLNDVGCFTCPMSIRKGTGFDWAGHHWHDGDEHGGQAVEDRPDQMDPDRPLPIRMLPAEVRKAEHGQADAHLYEWLNQLITYLIR